MFNLLYLNIIISIRIITSLYISIPFNVKNFSPDSISGITSKYYYKDIQINLHVGTPKQSILLSACLGEYTTFIIHFTSFLSKKSNRHCTKKGGFSPPFNLNNSMKKYHDTLSS